MMIIKALKLTGPALRFSTSLRQTSRPRNLTFSFGGKSGNVAMRRKVLQDFANVFCQRFIDLPSGHDLATFVYLGSGSATLDILSGECTFNGNPIRSLHTCAEDRKWLEEQCAKHHIPLAGILGATMAIAVDVTNVVVRSAFGYTHRSACFAFVCRSKIATDEKSYVGQAAGEKTWGFDFYWDELYAGTEPPMATISSDSR